MLVALYRSGPLRQRLAKGYAVAVPEAQPGRGAAELVAALLANPPLLPAMPTGQSAVLRGSPRTPESLWVDTGRVSLHDPAARANVAGALAASVAQVAAVVRERGGLLVPTGWQQGPDPTAGLCADLHSVEVLGDVQRELLANLVREHTPSLVALSGRQTFGPGGVAPGGSARLSRSFDQFSTRYVDSYSPDHVRRLRAGLLREERLTRLEAMDVNPLGEAEAGAEGDVTLRLFDAQVTVATAMAHALLVQALSMRAREMERTGRRVRLIPQPVLERNRGQAVVHGLAAEFTDGQGPGKNGRVSGQKGGGGGQQHGAERPPLPAGQAALRMLRELLPFFRQLDATATELGPLLTGLELAGTTTALAPVRHENDLLARWRADDATALAPERLAQGLGSPDWLTTDQIGAINRALAPGSTAAAQLWLEEQLSVAPPKAPKEPEQPEEQEEQEQQEDSGAGRPDPATAPALTAEQLLEKLGSPGIRAREIRDALRAYCRGQGTLDLTRPLRARGREEAKALRRLLRPRHAQRVRCAAPLESWDDPVAARALHGAGEHGLAMLHWDLPATERPRIREALRGLGQPPGGLRTVLLTDTTYTGGQDERRGTVEVLLVASREPGASRAPRKEAAG